MREQCYKRASLSFFVCCWTGLVVSVVLFGVFYWGLVMMFDFLFSLVLPIVITRCKLMQCTLGFLFFFFVFLSFLAGRSPPLTMGKPRHRSPPNSLRRVVLLFFCLCRNSTGWPDEAMPLPPSRRDLSLCRPQCEYRVRMCVFRCQLKNPNSHAPKTREGRG